MLLITVINKIQESCIHLFLIDRLVNYWIFHPRTLFFKKLLTQNFHILTYGLTYSKPLEIEDKIKIILVINSSVKYKNDKIFSST